MKPIALYWSGGGTTASNYGDSLSPYIVERLSGKHVVFARPHRADLIAIGSILEKAARSPWKHYLSLRRTALGVWGTGAIRDIKGKLPNFISIASIRGPLTRDMLDLDAKMPLGDPALLLRDILPVHGKQFRLGIVPHVSDWDAPAVHHLQASVPRSIVIDLRNPDLDRITRDIASSDVIVSSSLHGLIVADSYSVPNVRITFRNRLNGGSRKFIDYGASVGRFIEEAEVSDGFDVLESKAACASRQIIDMRIADCLAAAKTLAI
ncbi:polysaccharide pyruvyl transferase family protein [Rhizobium halophytocola]|uniref:Polysaccharide pyruvyl transferase domain-containing protein n=1 Tax=Rhizobium halophytocola TaxID=735519 RepID=A0ABS4E3X8_9HYPH|nr:polysaccharide pyruvyl transferase family protein [Rhizobium halophytocola]MBP1852648.1 hypothetical protein [Rhizobium halophytocola]